MASRERSAPLLENANATFIRRDRDLTRELAALDQQILDYETERTGNNARITKALKDLKAKQRKLLGEIAGSSQMRLGEDRQQAEDDGDGDN